MKVDRKKFAALCHTTYAIVATNCSSARGKIIEEIGPDGKKIIDTEHPINKAFFDKYQLKFEREKSQPPSTKKSGPKPKRVTMPTTDGDGNPLPEFLEALKWDGRKKKADALLRERQAEKALLDVKKMYGEMIPTDFVVEMFATFSKSLFSLFDNSLMNLASVYCDELAGGDREALTRVNKKLNEEFQRIIDSGSEIARKDMENMVAEFSQTRRKGQKK